jgi:hypothetical protein
MWPKTFGRHVNRGRPIASAWSWSLAVHVAIDVATRIRMLVDLEHPHTPRRRSSGDGDSGPMALHFHPSWRRQWTGERRSSSAWASSET